MCGYGRVRSIGVSGGHADRGIRALKFSIVGPRLDSRERAHFSVLPLACSIQDVNQVFPFQVKDIFNISYTLLRNKFGVVVA